MYSPPRFPAPETLDFSMRRTPGSNSLTFPNLGAESFRIAVVVAAAVVGSAVDADGHTPELAGRS